MEPLLCFPDPLPSELELSLKRAGYRTRPISSADHAEPSEPDDERGWLGAVVSAVGDLPAAVTFCRQLRRRQLPVSPLLLVVGTDQIGNLQFRDDLFDDFCVLPGGLGEIGPRLAHLLWRTGGGSRPDLIEHGPLQLNLETYQAAVSGRVLDLTYMEYELLRFLAANPAKVFTREALLSRVWGYEYYGGARTVDVHVRRLRAKLGEEHAHLIQTVRSVGYRFGQVGWVPGVAAIETRGG
jgi:DNA-binding response OmpR family regulator